MSRGDSHTSILDVLNYEIFYQNDSCIPETLSKGILKDTKVGKTLKILAFLIENEEPDEELDEDNKVWKLLTSKDENARIRFLEKVVSEIDRATGKDIKYCLWLCNSKTDAKRYFSDDRWKISKQDYSRYFSDEKHQISDSDISKYETSEVILAEYGGWEATLYGYVELPKEE